MRILGTALTLALVSAGCTTTSNATPGPARVNPLPADVQGLGPAVFVTNDGTVESLIAVARFGDEIAGVAPLRRRAEVALGDPRLPTVVHGLGDDSGKDGILEGGRLTDVELPQNTYVDRVFRLGPSLSGTGTWCLTIRADGAIARPAAESTCETARYGGAYWSAAPDMWGGINLSTGAATKAIVLPDYPMAASPDGRYLATVTDRLILADLTKGTAKPTVDLPEWRDQPGVFTKDGYALVHDQKLSVVHPDGTLRNLLAPVSEAAFSSDGRYALADDSSGLAVVDLYSGAVRRIAGSSSKHVPYLVVAGHQALVVEIDNPGIDHPGPASASAVDLTTARRRAVALSVPEETDAQVMDPVDGLASLQLRGSGDVLTITTAGTVTLAPRGALPYLPLPGGRVLYRLDKREDALLVADDRGGHAEIRTGAGAGEDVGDVVVAGDHLILALSGRQPPSAETTLVRLDGTGKPLVLYRGAVLASLG